MTKGVWPLSQLLEVGFEFGDLVDATLMTSAFKCLRQEDLHDLLGNTRANNASAHREHVRIVVFAGHARGVQAVTQCGTNTTHLVGRKLFALATATEHDPEVSLAVADRTADARADLWVVDRLGRVGPLVIDGVPSGLHESDQVLLEVVARVVGADCDSCHRRRV